MKIIWRVIKEAAPWRKYIVMAIFAMVLITAVNIITPIIVRELLKRLADDSATVSIVIWLAMGVLGLYILRAFLHFIDDYFAHVAALNVTHVMRVKTYNQVQNLSAKFFADKQTGQIVSRISTDTERFENLIAHALPDMLISFVTFVSVITIIFIINSTLALYVCIPIPFVFGIAVIARKTHRHLRKYKQTYGETMGLLTDNLQGVKEIQVFNKQSAETTRVNAKSKQLAKEISRAVFWRSILNPTIWLFQGLGTVAIILFGGIMAIKGVAPMSYSAADITAFMLYVGLLYAPVANLARIIEDLQEAVTSGRRVFEIIDEKSEVQNRPNAQDVGVLNGNISFSGVRFNYKAKPNAEVQQLPAENETDEILKELENVTPTITEAPPHIPDVLSNISFDVSAGAMIALVGPTGAGKSTILSLLTRFYDVTAGAITIDGIDIRDMTLDSLRNNISVVLQDVFLFNGTIAENIAYGRSDNVSEDEIINAAKTAAIHGFIETLPDGYQTQIGERGTKLSGGQKQRLAIARAILRNSPILILDEATSAVDNETEREIQNAINAIAGKRTIIVVAHRLSTVERADQILYLENGRIVERGTHTKLMKLNGAYAKMRKII